MGVRSAIQWARKKMRDAKARRVAASLSPDEVELLILFGRMHEVVPGVGLGIDDAAQSLGWPYVRACRAFAGLLDKGAIDKEVPDVR